MERETDEHGLQGDESLQENEMEGPKLDEKRQNETAQANISGFDAGSSPEGLCV